MVGGGGGEALGMLAAGQELKGEEIFLEAIGEAKGIVNTADIVKAAVTKSSYKLNGEPVSQKKIQEVLDSPNTSVEDLAEMDIEVTNDKAFDNYVKKTQGDAILESQIDARVPPEARKKLVELEKKRRVAEKSAEKTGIFRTFGIDNKLENIKSEIESIMSEYENIDRRTKEVRDRKATADKVKKSRQKIYLKKTESFAEIERTVRF